MIVPSMGPQEIHNEIFKDVRDLKNMIELQKGYFKKVVLRAKRYPISKSYAFRSQERMNFFNVGFMATKRSSWKKPIINLYCTYSRPEGMYAAAPSIDLGITSIYPPHFFLRYRERILKNRSISNEEVIKDYFANDWGFMGTIINDAYESVYYSFEEYSTSEKISFVAATNLGFCFGVKLGAVNIIKTILSEDMLYENQKKLFINLRTEFNMQNNERYGSSPF